jgi:hypothetical protein
MSINLNVHSFKHWLVKPARDRDVLRFDSNYNCNTMVIEGYGAPTNA